LVEAPPKTKPGPKGGVRKSVAAKGTAGLGTATPQAKTPRPPAKTLDQSPDGLSGARERYVEMLLAKAAQSDQPDDRLLDRIERALGIAPATGGGD
jgi:hypothetical protein